jgi:hypothetical protein
MSTQHELFQNASSDLLHTIHVLLHKQEPREDSQDRDLEREGPVGKHAPRTPMHRGTSFKR